MTEAASAMAKLRLRTAASLAPTQAAGLCGLPGLNRGQVHDWFLANTSGASWRKSPLWHPPLTVMSKVAVTASLEGNGKIVWIGRRCWPALQVLCALAGQTTADALSRSLFLDPLTDRERFWAIGQSLRCAGIAAVVADGSGINQTVSRRLQLAAEGGEAIGLLARPAWESEEASWAATRWELRPRMGGIGPGWEIELKSCRGRHREQDAPRTWIAEWSYRVFCGSGTLDISADVGRGVAAPPGEWSAETA